MSERNMLGPGDRRTGHIDSLYYIILCSELAQFDFVPSMKIRIFW